VVIERWLVSDVELWLVSDVELWLVSEAEPSRNAGYASQEGGRRSQIRQDGLMTDGS